jgi:phasin family protein
VVDKPVFKNNAAPSAATKPVAKPAPIAKPVAAAKVEVPKPAPAMARVDAPMPAPAAPVAAPMVAKAVTAKPEPAPGMTAPTPTKTPEAVAAPVIAEGKTIMNDTINKVQETAQNFASDTTARATEMFGDVSARAKTAMEKGSKSVEELVEFSKGNLEAVVASGRVAAKGAQDIAKYSADYGRKSIEDATATARKFAAVKSPTEFFALQSEVAKSQLDALVGEASKFTEGYMKLLGEIVQPMQNRFAVAVEKAKSVVAA